MKCEYRIIENGGWALRICLREAQFLITTEHGLPYVRCMYHMQGVYQDRSAVVTRLPADTGPLSDRPN